MKKITDDSSCSLFVVNDGSVRNTLDPRPHLRTRNFIVKKNKGYGEDGIDIYGKLFLIS